MENTIFNKACTVSYIIEQEVDTFNYIDLEEKIDGIIYYVNSVLDYNIDMADSRHYDFFENTYYNCYNTAQTFKYPYDEGEPTISQLDEKLEALTFVMIQSVVKDFIEYTEME